MKEVNREEIEKWIEIWEQAGSALNKVKLKELRATDYYTHNKIYLNEMLRYAFEHRIPRLSSGLVEQQQIFMKIKKKMTGIHEL